MKLRLGVLGSAKIANSFVEGVRPSAHVEVVAVASRTPERAAIFARAHNVERVVESYDALLADPNVDAIYIPLPNGLHKEWTLKALQSKKHVLCEKPLAPNESDARAMFDAAQANGVLLLEAFPFHFQPQTLEVSRLLAADAIGDVSLLQASFGFPLTDPGNVRLDPALAGGALMDVGCYPVSFARLVFGKRPLRVSAFARWAGTGVDMTLVANLDFEGAGLAQISCTMSGAVHRRAVVVGSRGVIETDYLNHTDRVRSPSLRIKRVPDAGADFDTMTFAAQNGFRLEAEAFARMVVTGHGGDDYLARSKASLDTAATLEAILSSARTGLAITVGAAS